MAYQDLDRGAERGIRGDWLSLHSGSPRLQSGCVACGSGGRRVDHFRVTDFDTVDEWPGLVRTVNEQPDQSSAEFDLLRRYLEGQRDEFALIDRCTEPVNERDTNAADSLVYGTDPCSVELSREST